MTIVWRNATTNSIDARVYNGTLLATGTLVSGTSATTVSNPTVTRCSPTIRALLTYSANGLGTTSVRAQLFNRTSATAIAAAFSIASTSLLGSVGNAVNCGDGVSFVVAWEGDSVLGRRVNCVSVRHNGVVEELGASRSIAGVGIDARSPDLAWLDNSVVVGWASQTGSTYDIRITSIDPFTCLDCEGEFLIGSGANNTVSVTSCITGATVRDFGGVTFTLGNPANPLLRLFATIDGTQTHLGGGPGLQMAHRQFLAYHQLGKRARRFVLGLCVSLLLRRPGIGRGRPGTAKRSTSSRVTSRMSNRAPTTVCNRAAPS